jgi:hypothetical protein
MFYVSNEIQYRVVCVPNDPDEHWYFANHYDNLSDAQSGADANNRRHPDCRYHVTAIGGADSLRAGFSNTPPAAV